MRRERPRLSRFFLTLMLSALLLAGVGVVSSSGPAAPVGSVGSAAETTLLSSTNTLVPVTTYDFDQPSITSRITPDMLSVDLPDLVVCSVVCQRGTGIAFTVANIGRGSIPDNAEGAADVWINGRYMGFVNLDLHQHRELLKPGGSATYLAPWMPEQNAAVVRVEVDSRGCFGHAIDESDEGNNFLEEMVESCGPAPPTCRLTDKERAELMRQVPPAGNPTDVKKLQPEGASSGATGGVTVLVDGRPIAVPGEPAAFIDAASGRTMVPVRFVSQALGAAVEWDAAVRKVTIRRGNQVVETIVGSRQATVNGRVVELDVASRIVQNRTFVPLRFVSAALGDTVEWNQAARRVEIKFAG
ncbi:MAG: stalk domain-containing protein [Bacillota bacterium]